MLMSEKTCFFKVAFSERFIMRQERNFKTNASYIFVFQLEQIDGDISLSWLDHFQNI